MIEPGDLVKLKAVLSKLDGEGRYTVAGVVEIGGESCALIDPWPSGIGPQVPVPLYLLEVVSKGDVQ